MIWKFLIKFNGTSSQIFSDYQAHLSVQCVVPSVGQATLTFVMLKYYIANTCLRQSMQLQLNCGLMLLVI